MSESIHNLTGAYAVDALDELERARFETHLRSCEDCQEEVSSLRTATTELGASAASAPPPELRAAVLAGIAQIRPLPPIAAPADATRRTSDAANIPQPGRAHGAPEPTSIRWRFLAVAAAVLAIASLSWGVVSQRTASDARDTAASLAAAQADNADALQFKALIDAEDLKVDAATDAKTGVTTTVFRSAAMGKSAAMFTDLPTIDADQQFEAWRQDEEFHLTSSGVFDATNGRALYMLDDNYDAAQALAVTIEQRGGAPDGKATTAPIAQVTFKA